MYFRQIKCKYRAFNNEMTSFPLNIRISLGKDQRCDEYLSVNIMREDSRWSWLFEASRCQRRSQRWRRDQRTSLHPTLPPPETDNHQWYFLRNTHILQSSLDSIAVSVFADIFIELANTETAATTLWERVQNLWRASAQRKVLERCGFW